MNSEVIEQHRIVSMAEAEATAYEYAVLVEALSGAGHIALRAR